MENKREIFTNLLLSRVGMPYIFGGNGPQVFDCSGLMCWGLREVGILTDEDLSSKGLFDFFHTHKILCPDKIGQILFYGTSGDITHCMAVCRFWDGSKFPVLIGARGGDNRTRSLQDAYSAGAMVDVVAGTYWRGSYICTVDPFSRKA